MFGLAWEGRLMFGLAWLARQWSGEHGEPFANPKCNCSHCHKHRGQILLALVNTEGGRELLGIEAGR